MDDFAVSLTDVFTESHTRAIHAALHGAGQVTVPLATPLFPACPVALPWWPRAAYMYLALSRSVATCASRGKPPLFLSPRQLHDIQQTWAIDLPPFLDLRLVSIQLPQKCR